MKVIVMMGLACIAVGAFIGTSVGKEDQMEPNTWGPVVGGCRLALKPSRSSYRYDQPIVLHLILENVDKADVLYVEKSVATTYRLDVRLPNGKVAPLTLEGQRQALVPSGAVSKTLKPGGVVTDAIPMLNRLYDMTLLAEYTVTAYRSQVVPGGHDQKAVEVSSNTIKVVVTEDVASTMPAAVIGREPKGYACICANE